MKIPCNSIKDLWSIFVAFLVENQEYIHFGGQVVEDSLWISLNLFNGLSEEFCPGIEIAPEQLEDFIKICLDFLDRNYQYINSIVNDLSETTFDFELIALSNNFEINADGFVDFALQYIAPTANDNNVKAFLTRLFKSIKTVFEGSTVLGAKILHFILDEDGVAYHSQPSTWQRAFGYNDLYDLAFDIGSFMHKARYKFKSNDVTYALWMWKGDYWNLQSGAEIGLYYIDNNRHQISENAPHYYSINYTLPMSLSLYNHYGDSYTNVFCWYPDEEQWWITGFNAHSEFCEPHPEDMIAIVSIDFSSAVDLYDDLKITSFKDKEDLENYFYFDDKNCILWIIFTQDDGREYNFAYKFF